MSSEPNLLVEHPSDGVLLLKLNRPDKMNALATPLLKEVSEAMRAGDEDSTIRVMVITGNAKAFAAGADINELSKRSAIDGLNDDRPFIWNSIRAVRKPILAAVEGYCLGAGNELLMCADIAIAGQGAKFGQPESNLGIIPGAGGATLLPRLVGQQRAMRMVLLGEFITAEEAKSCGLISEVTEKGRALPRTLELGSKIAARAPLAMQQGKAVVKGALNSNLTSGLTEERQAFSLLLSTEDKKLGIEAFLNKEKAHWEGK